MDRERLPDLEIPQQKGAFIQALSPQPAGDLFIAFAGIARAACGNDVIQSVASPTRQSPYAIALQWLVNCSAVRTAAPRLLESSPLLVAEVVLDAIHTALAPSGRAGSAASAGSHRSRVTRGRLESFGCPLPRTNWRGARPQNPDLSTADES